MEYKYDRIRVTDKLSIEPPSQGRNQKLRIIIRRSAQEFHPGQFLTQEQARWAGVQAKCIRYLPFTTVDFLYIQPINCVRSFQVSYAGCVSPSASEDRMITKVKSSQSAVNLPSAFICS